MAPTTPSASTRPIRNPEVVSRLKRAAASMPAGSRWRGGRGTPERGEPSSPALVVPPVVAAVVMAIRLLLGDRVVNGLRRGVRGGLGVAALDHGDLGVAERS